MFDMVIIIYNILLQVAKRVDLKDSHHKKIDGNYVWW